MKTSKNLSSTSSSATTSATTTPFQSIFLSTTRPITTPTSSTSSSSSNHYKPYTILFQHSQKLHQRIIASEQQQQQQQQNVNTSAIDTNEHRVYDTPSEMNTKNNLGCMFILQAWKECVKRCNGKVIVVQTTSRGLCLNGSGIGSGGSGSGGKSKESDLFHHNGVIIDLYSDPMGWDDDDDDDNDEDSSNVNVNDTNQFKGQTNDLQSILKCIQKATNHIMKNNDNGINTNTNQQPIPIIFDSITPLLIHHGVHKFTLFISHLKNNNNNNNNNNNHHHVTSPIFLPTNMEYLSPKLNQTLEDFSDSVLSLYNGQLHIAKRSANASQGGGMVYPGFSGGLRLVKDIQYFEWKKNTRELILLSSAKSGSSSGKIKNVSDSATATNDNDNNKHGSNNMNNDKHNENRVGHQHQHQERRRDDHNKDGSRKTSIKLEHENDSNNNGNNNSMEMMNANANANINNKPTPRIYIEDNDPEYADLDEEDPDDDLDI